MEICLDGLRVSVCDGDKLDFSTTAVVCRQLNYNGYKQHYALFNVCTPSNKETYSLHNHKVCTLVG